MQTKPANWDRLLAADHSVVYSVTVNGVAYGQAFILEPPTLSRPMLDTPAIGRCCTGSLAIRLNLTSANIRKAASVQLRCALTDGTTTTAYISLGKYFVTSRVGGKPVSLTCLDSMIKAGQTYLDKTAFTTWPQSMTDVVNEICTLMDVTLDSRTVINTGAAYTVDYPNEDTLMSEILSMIAAAHGGNWIITPTGQLRLVIFASPKATADVDIGKTHYGYTPLGKPFVVSRVTLVDSAQNEFTAGDNTGQELAAVCNYATPGIAQTAAAALSGATYEPYSVQTAYLDPCAELGDTVRVVERSGTAHQHVIVSQNIKCTVACTSDITAGTDEETEQEFPYISIQDLKIERAVRTDQTYYGNTITRENGFVSELIVNDTPTARLIANATTFSMSKYNGSTWEDKIYYDINTGKYVISADVTVNGALTINKMKTELAAASGSTYINGANIITGTISADAIKVNTVYNSAGDRIAIYSNGTSDLYVGGVVGNTGWNFNKIYIFADSSITIGNYSNYGTRGLVFDNANGALYPVNSWWALGSASDPFSITHSRNYNIYFYDSGSSTHVGSIYAEQIGLSKATIISTDYTVFRTQLSTNTSMVVDTASSQIYPYTNNSWYVGTASRYFAGAYINYVYCTSINVSSSLSMGLSVNINPQTSQMNSLYLSGSLTVQGSVVAYGGKNRLVSTKNYANRLLYCLESPEALFEDIGEAETDMNGRAYIFFDPVFAETIYAYGYQVFLQPYGNGSVYVTNRNDLYIAVSGTPNLAFGWRVIAKQSDYTDKRLDEAEELELPKISEKNAPEEREILHE